MEKLIELVRGFPELYDTSHEDYMKGKLKDDLWERIANELDTNPPAAKEQWRKLRECHREALRRQQKKSEQQNTPSRLWTYQREMEFLLPFMKNRNTVEYQTLPPVKILLEENDISLYDASAFEATNDSEASEPSENVATKRFKRSTKVTDPVVKKFIEDSDKKAKQRDELQQNIVAEIQKQQELQNDGLYQFFMSMYNITKDLPHKYQKEVRRKLFQAVSDAEDKAEDELAEMSNIKQISQIKSELFPPSNSSSIR